MSFRLPKATRAHEERKFYEAHPFAGSVYTALKKATNPTHKKALWAMLTDEQKAEVKRIRETPE